MKIQIIGSTKPQYQLSIQEAIQFSGKSAGICYMPDTIETLFTESEEKSIKRANNTLKMGHHSVFDHVVYNLSLSNIPKILAMLLNNEGIYTTSEKSARYTKMQLQGIEKERYEKWISIFQEEIKKQYPEMEEKKILKLAMENARYLISIFTPSTTMEYTVSLRQLNYIVSFFKNYIAQEADTPFSKKLKPVLQDFINQMQNIVVEGLNADEKSRKLSLFATRDYQQEFGECYSINYEGTFAQYAQAQRHRTLRYNLRIPEIPKFYIPALLKQNQELCNQWKEDCHILEQEYPQGMLVSINERGNVEDFILKCKERLCGCAQLEIMLQTKETLECYLANTKNTNKQVYQYLEPYQKGIRCLFPDYRCPSACIWGPKKALERLV